ncbi:uncharacterized protein L969DRAFT_17995 [Mixia osmundae IAM 14324]|uniref:BHLH domain-containing protein n=1 Tax=Mixia osmundae (strain CBS 9802 / IAM 14324 / JCM 22182 / KY 12970) TaxID=764103 RepID=G7E7F1_MIXOS|nr:uncharacterized protein L969DRAFT_17995 [Mixia osmundae IAM 14324]KEI38921.1 hypothetical protein L969DRAFT_17995 [Mixia osmundae IAM 14324]GAA98761.1 hypothetical protein E5Q_05449 [Mixia osmundae IAM 14324]
MAVDISVGLVTDDTIPSRPVKPRHNSQPFLTLENSAHYQPVNPADIKPFAGERTLASSTSIKKGKKLPTSAERRATHNATERARRESLNSRFLQLAGSLPTMARVKRPSKSIIVSKSLEFINNVRSRERYLLARNANLREQVDSLREQLGLEKLPPADEEDTRMDSMPEGFVEGRFGVGNYDMNGDNDDEEEDDTASVTVKPVMHHSRAQSLQAESGASQNAQRLQNVGTTLVDLGAMQQQQIQAQVQAIAQQQAYYNAVSLQHPGVFQEQQMHANGAFAYPALAMQQHQHNQRNLAIFLQQQQQQELARQQHEQHNNHLARQAAAPTPFAPSEDERASVDPSQDSYTDSPSSPFESIMGSHSSELEYDSSSLESSLRRASEASSASSVHSLPVDLTPANNCLPFGLDALDVPAYNTNCSREPFNNAGFNGFSFPTQAFAAY